jgi:hypothetical protein
MTRNILLVIFASLAFTARGDQSTTPTPTLGIDRAITIAMDQTKGDKDVLFVKSAILTNQADWGLVWVVEFEIVQPQFHSHGQAPTGAFDRAFIDKNGGIQMNASQLMHALESLITPWDLQVCVTMDGRTNSAYVAQYKPGAAHYLQTAFPVPGKKGYCSSPYCVSASYTNTHFLPGGEIIRCVYTELPFVIPESSP